MGLPAVRPCIAWTGSELGVAWRSGQSGGRQLWFARLTAQGYWISAPKELVQSTWAIGEPRLAQSKDAYAVTWYNAVSGSILITTGPTRWLRLNVTLFLR